MLLTLRNLNKKIGSLSALLIILSIQEIGFKAKPGIQVTCESTGSIPSANQFFCFVFLHWEKQISMCHISGYDFIPLHARNETLPSSPLQTVTMIQFSTLLSHLTMSLQSVSHLCKEHFGMQMIRYFHCYPTTKLHHILKYVKILWV